MTDKKLEDNKSQQATYFSEHQKLLFISREQKLSLRLKIEDLSASSWSANLEGIFKFLFDYAKAIKEKEIRIDRS